MKTTRGQALIAAALICALASTSALAQGLPTTGTVESRLGKLELKNGFPTEETVQKLYDDLDFQRACQAYIWALPYMAMTEWQRQQREVFGARNLDYVDYLSFTDKLGILILRLYGPTEAAIDKSWKPGDIEKMK